MSSAKSTKIELASASNWNILGSYVPGVSTWAHHGGGARSSTGVRGDLQYRSRGSLRFSCRAVGGWFDAAVSAPFEGSAARGIGGNQADNAASRAGAVYVFSRSGTPGTNGRTSRHPIVTQGMAIAIAGAVYVLQPPILSSPSSPGPEGLDRSNACSYHSI